MKFPNKDIFFEHGYSKQYYVRRETKYLEKDGW